MKRWLWNGFGVKLLGRQERKGSQWKSGRCKTKMRRAVVTETKEDASATKMGRTPEKSQEIGCEK